ncbi:helix-turn-helix transcriptional regulator [Lentzea sp. NPDC051838]|uniref:helix-turn-helix domain-containing protein n=1 Tax=Lentzea sp. NPDC051838 TaxID=3154849 RepID=UPI00342A8DB1
MPKRFSTARGREFGDGLRAAIANTGMTARAVAEIVGWQEAKMSDVVNGKGGATELELAMLLGACRTPPVERDHLLVLFNEANLKGWWQEHGACTPIRPRTLIEHERSATKLISWQVSLVHALLQLPAYARAVIAAGANVPDDEVEERVQARIERQTVLDRGLDCLFYLHESALLPPIGGEEAMRAQRNHLLKMARRPYVELRIVPFAAGAHAGLAGSFDLLTFERYEPVVFLDNENSSLIVEAPYALMSYERVLEALDEVALGVQDSKELIKRLLT